MAMRRILCAALLVWFISWASAPALAAYDFSVPPPEPPSQEVALVVPPGTTVQVVLDEETRVKKVGQPIHGRVVDPVFAFDQEVIPVDSEVIGRIAEIEPVSRGRRFLEALSFNFSPPRKVRVEFDEIILPNGKHIPVKATVTPGSGRPLQLITTADKAKQQTVKDVATDKMKEAVRDAKAKWDEAMKQVKTPGRTQRLKRYAVAQLPVHPQYLEPGTVFFAELQQPLNFGTKRFFLPDGTDEAPLPSCSLLAHAQLLTPLSSATTAKDDRVEAILTRPLLAGDRLLFPQGSLLKGSVVYVEKARSFKRNGQLRIGFNQLVFPDGLAQEVTTSLEGIQGGQEELVQLDSEGGTRAGNSKKRFVFTGIAVGLAAASHQDSDAEDGVSSTQGGVKEGVAGGANALKLAGAVAGALIRSQTFSFWMGMFGAGRSVYTNFISRGREVTFPKGTAMEVGLWLTENCENPPNPDEGKKTSSPEEPPQGERP